MMDKEGLLMMCNDADQHTSGGPLFRQDQALASISPSRWVREPTPVAGLGVLGGVESGIVVD